MKAHLPISITGYNVYLLSDRQIRVTQSNKTCISILQHDDHIDIYRIPDHTRLSDPLMSLTLQISDLSESEIKRLIIEAARHP